VPDYIEIVIQGGGPRPGPPMPTLRRILSAQDTHCRNGQTTTVVSNQKVYVLGPDVVDPATLPLVDRRDDARTDAIGYAHYVTSSGKVISPVPSLPSLAGARIPGALGGPFQRGTAFVMQLQEFSSFETYTDATCATQPVVPEGSTQQGNLHARIDGEAQCESIPGLGGVVTKVYQAGPVRPFDSMMYLWNGAE